MAYRSQTIIRGSHSRNPRWELKAEAMEGTLLTSLLPGLQAATFLIEPIPTCPGIALPPYIGSQDRPHKQHDHRAD